MTRSNPRSGASWRLATLVFSCPQSATRQRRSRGPVNPHMSESQTRRTSAPIAGSGARSPLEGDWRSQRQYVELRKGTGKIVIPFNAAEVNLVMQPGVSGNASVRVLLDGKPVGEARGADVGADGVARFDRSGMIRLVAGASRRRHVLTLVTSDPGVRAFAFTFGP